MAVDSLLNKVVELTQGGSTTNQVLPPAPRQRTLTGITAGADHMVFAPDGVFESKDGRTAAWYSPPYANIEFVVELDPVWAMGALIAKGYMWSLTCAESGVLRITLGYAGNVELSDLVVPTTGKLYVSIRLLKDDSYDLLDFFIDVQPEAGTRRTWVRQGTLSSSILMLTWVSFGRWADVVLGAQAHDVKVAAPAGVASASWVIATQGYGAAYSAARSTYSESYPYIIGVSYTPPDNPNNISEDNYWRTLGAQAFDNGVALGPPVVVSLSLPKNSMTRFQAETVLFQRLAALLPGAVATTDTWGDPPVTLHVMETTESGYQRPTAATYEYTQINERVTLGLPLLTSPTQTWVVRGRANYLNDTPVTDWAQMYGKTVTPGVYGSGDGMRTVTRLTVNKYTSDPCTLLLGSVTYPMTSIAIGGDLHTALTTNWPNTTATAVNANTTVFNLPLTWVGPLLTPLTLPNVYITSSPVSAIDKLYALRVTEAAREADAAFPALPWPISAIPPATGGGSSDTNTLLLMHFDESSGTTLADETGRTFTTTDIATHTTASGKFSRGVFPVSNTWDGAEGSSPVNISGGVFTIEFFVARRGAGGTTAYEVVFAQTSSSGTWADGLVVFVSGDNNLVQAYLDGIPTPGAIIGNTPGVWQHIALVRSGNGGTDTKWYVNGVGESGFATGYATHANVNPNIGNTAPSAGYRLNSVGIDELRISNVARYTADFTAPTAPFDNTAPTAPISNSALYLRFEDGAGNATAANSGAGGGLFSVTPHAIVSSQHQDGTGSLQLTGVVGEYTSFTPITGPGTGDYTAEMWVRFPSLGAGSSMFAGNFNTGGFYVGDNGQIGWIGGNNSNGMGDVVPNVWHHIAAVRQTGMVYFYLNGVMSSSTSGAPNTANLAAPFGLGEDNSYGAGVAVFIDEYRFTNSALYTSNFTPESPLDDTPIVAPTNDVTGAGYNDIEELLGSGTGNAQDYFPDAYGTSNTTLDDAEAAYTAYVDAADITGTGTTTLDAFTNSGAGAAAIPTDITADYTFDDFTSAADGVADLPLEVTADYTFEDIVSISVGLFLSPAEGSGDSVLDDFAVTTFTASTITPPTAQATFSLPALRATASGTPTVFDGALLTLPALAAAAQGGHYSTFSLPRITAEATGTTIAMARAIMTVPMVEVEATGRVAGQSSVQTRLPRIEVSSFGGHQAEITLPEITATATATVGSAAQAELSLPRITVTAHGYRDDTARADITLPMLVMTPSAVAEITLPAFTVLAHGQPVLTNAYEAYVLNMNQPLDDNPRNNFEAKVEQVTRYTNWPFIQVVRLGSTYYGVAEDGLYELGGTTDNGTEITWSFETCKTDFDDPHKKAVASAYIGGQAGATVDYTLRSGDDVDHMYGYVTTKVIQKRNHRQKFGLGRRVRYYSFGLAGSGKAAIDMLEFELLNTTRRI